MGARIGGRYQLVRPLARGGMGRVWVAHHLELHRRVAIKLLEVTGDDQATKLLDEARLLARLQHPNVVAVFDCGTEPSGAPFIVMELLDGPTLATYLAQHGALGAVMATQLFLPLLDGLSAVHAAGLVHRDIKPDNVVIVAGTDDTPQPKLIDFGIARAQRVGAPTTLSFAGTPQYMAPEQTQGAAGDVRSDVWSATAMFYEMVCGRPAFAGEELQAVFRAITHEPPAFPAEVRDFDGRLWTIITRGLRKSPSERFEDCDAFRSTLRAWLAQVGASSARRALPAIPRTAPALSSPVDVTLEAIENRFDVVEGPLDILRRKRDNQS